MTVSKKLEMNKAAESIAGMVIEWVDGGVKMNTDWRTGLANVIQLRLNRLDAQSELAALREDLTKATDKIDQAWNRKSCVDHKGFIPGALDAWKRPVPQDLPYDFSGNPGASATQYCNGWNDSGSYWSAHANELQQRLAAAEQRNAEWRELLRVMTNEYACCLEAGYDRITSLRGDCDSVAKMLAGNPNYAKAVAALAKPTESGASE